MTHQLRSIEHEYTVNDDAEKRRWRYLHIMRGRTEVYVSAGIETEIPEKERCAYNNYARTSRRGTYLTFTPNLVSAQYNEKMQEIFCAMHTEDDAKFQQAIARLLRKTVDAFMPKEDKR